MASQQFSSPAATTLSKDTKMAMTSQFLGFMLDAYDMAMVIVMAPILGKIFISPKGSQLWQYIAVVLGYSITMAARPVGSAFFGAYADKIGRRFLLMFTIGGVGIMSLLSGFLPTYAQAGVLAYVLYCVLRFFMGCFFGGEYAVGHTFAIEYAPQKRRGAISGFIQSGFPLGYVLASLVFAAFPTSAAKPSCAQYGWRIAFITGVVPVFLALWIRNNLHESPEFEKAKAAGKSRRPLSSASSAVRKYGTFLQVFCLYDRPVPHRLLGVWIPAQDSDPRWTRFRHHHLQPDLRIRAVPVVPGLQLLRLDLRPDRTKDPDAVVLRVSGRLRRAGLLRALPCGPCQRNIKLAILGCCMAGMLKLAWGIVPAYLCERFPTRRRAAGVGFGYSAGAILGAWFPLYVLWAHKIPFIHAIEGKDTWLSPAVILTIGAIMTFVSLLFSPETKDLQLDEVGEKERASDRAKEAARRETVPAR